jgi:TolA-binding protein
MNYSSYHMELPMSSKSFPKFAPAFAAVVILFASIVAGCSGSDQSQKDQPSAAPHPPTATELMQQEAASLRMENDSLRQGAGKLSADNRALLSRIAAMQTAVDSLKAKYTPPKVTVANGLDGYVQALTLFRQGNDIQSMATFEAAQNADIPERLKDNCCYWIGECLYALKEYDAAIDQFQKVFAFARSEKKDDAQMMTANSYLAMGNRQKAKEQYEILVKKFPASPFVKRAKEKLAGL